MEFEVYRTRQKQDEPERHCVKHTFPRVAGPSCYPDSDRLVTVVAFRTPFKLGTFVPPCECRGDCGCNLMLVKSARQVTDNLF